jgi:hypothetical protein
LSINSNGVIETGRLPANVVDSSKRASSPSKMVRGKIVLIEGDDAYFHSRFPTILVTLKGLPDHPRGLSLSAEYHSGKPAQLIFPQGDVDSGNRFALRRQSSPEISQSQETTLASVPGILSP